MKSLIIALLGVGALSADIEASYTFWTTPCRENSGIEADFLPQYVDIDTYDQIIVDPKTTQV